jgi:glycosyltransferase involved in cell wall biosynthesis
MLRKKAKSADIIHGHYAFCGWLARSAMGTPVVCSFMGDDLLGSPDNEGRVSGKGKLIVQSSRMLARLVDAVIVKSPEMAKIVAPVKAHVVPNGVDIDQFKPMDQASAKNELGWNQDKRYVLFPGNPENPRKGFRLASDALDLAQQQTGDPLEMAVLRNVAPEQVPIYMNACDAMFMTSWVEGSPNVVKEAMACDLPLVSVRVGDVEQLLTGVHGYTICQRNPETIAMSVLELLADRQPAEGRAALIRLKLDATSVARRLIDIYLSILSARPSELSPVKMEGR